MIPFVLEVRDADVTAAFNRLMAACGDLTPANRAIAMTLLSRTEGNFSAQAGPSGPWPALSAAVAKRRGAGARMLQDTGRLAGSVTPFWSDAEAGVGSNVIYAAIQHLGGRAGRGHQVSIPARAYLPATAAGLQAGVADDIAGILARHIRGGGL